MAGALASLTTTLCNIFLTTASNTVKIIRESWASLVEAGENLFINPKNYEFGDLYPRPRPKILAVGASVVIGTVVREAVAKDALRPTGGSRPLWCRPSVRRWCRHHELYAAAVS